MRYFTRVSVDAWNYFVAHVTGGLVYGREIPRPAWLKVGAEGERRRAKRAREVGTPRVEAAARRRALVLEGLLAGETLAAIAGRLGVAFSTVCQNARRIYRAHGVRTRRELAGAMANVRRQLANAGAGAGRAAG